MPQLAQSPFLTGHRHIQIKRSHLVAPPGDQQNVWLRPLATNKISGRAAWRSEKYSYNYSQPTKISNQQASDMQVCMFVQTT